MSRPRFRPFVYEYKKDNGFIIKISTNTTDVKPSVVFLRGKVKITPSTVKKTYEEEIIELREKFEKRVRDILSRMTSYSQSYIFSVDIAEKSVKHNKTSHFHYDIFLKPLKTLEMSEHKENLLKISEKFENYLIELFEDYSLIIK